jgi:uroporphyrinogen decarboxylase
VITSKSRFQSAVAWQAADRPPVDFHATGRVEATLRARLGVATHQGIHEKLGTDFRRISPRYVGPERRTFEDGSREGLWGERRKDTQLPNGIFYEMVRQPFAEVTDVSELRGYPFPRADWWDYSTVSADCDRYTDCAVVTGYMAATYADMSGGLYSVPTPSAPDFINGIAKCRGYEQVLVDIALEDPVFRYLVDQRSDFCLEVYRKVLAAGSGKIDVLYLGEDLGNQNGLTISPNSFRLLFSHHYRRFMDLAHAHGARAMMHSCGAVAEIIPQLIDLGLDIIDVLQPEANDLQALKMQFEKQIVFAGTMSVQTLLPRGSPADIAADVERKRRLFPDGGLILAPTNAIQPDTPVANILALYRAAGSMVSDHRGISDSLGETETGTIGGGGADWSSE